MLRNIEAVKEITQMTRTSYGPNGMNKIIINHIDKQFLTKDSGVILRELDVNHPAAKLVVNAVKMQEQEVGDNTNYVSTIAGELLNQAEALIKKGLHPSEILSGYELAWKRSLQLLQENSNLRKVENLRDKNEISRYLTNIIGTKLLHSQEDFLAPLIAQACISILPSNPETFNNEYVRVAKMLGGNLLESSVVKGMVVLRNVEGSITKVDV
jgi:T-complex protein 1 subunit theta